MFRRKLLALDYQSAESFDASKQEHYRTLVVWLEDQKIRHYKIDERGGLRDVQNGSWSNALHQYLNDLSCPVINSSTDEILGWLIGLAIRLEFGDKAEEYRKYNAAFVADSRSEQPKIVSDNPLDNLDFTTPEFRAGVESLADYLQVTKHPDHLITLQAICRLVSRRINPKAIMNAKNIVPEGDPYPFREHDLGFDTGDFVLNDAAKILRLLYLNDLRELQTKINEAIVAVQSITANPKTDTRLGKVGR